MRRIARRWGVAGLRRSLRTGLVLAVLTACAEGESAALTTYRLSGDFVGPVGDVLSFAITADGARAVYLASQDTAGVREIYSRPMDGSGAAIKLNDPLDAGAEVVDFVLSGDGAQVVYRIRRSDGALALYSRRVDGSGTPIMVTTPAVPTFPYTISPGGQVVYIVVRALYSRPLDASTPAVRLSDGSPTTTNVIDFRLSADGSRVVYLADQDTDEVVEVYSRVIDGSAPAIKLNGPLVTGGDATAVRISPNSATVVYVADQDVDNRQELYRRPIDGSGQALKLNGPFASGGTVSTSIAISADSARVAYMGRTASADPTALYAVPIDGSAAPILLSGAPASGAVRDFELAATGATAVFRLLASPSHVYSVALDGSTAPVQLSGTLANSGAVRSFAVSRDSQRVIYTAEQDTVGLTELYSRPIDGSGVPTKLNGPIVGDGDVTAAAIAADSRWVVYLAPQDTAGMTEVYSRRIDGTGSPAKLNGMLDPLADVNTDYTISPTADRVAYRAAQAKPGVTELFSRPIDGSDVDRRLNGPLVTGGGVMDARASADGRYIVYRADQDTNQISELYSVLADGSAPPVKMNGPLGPGGEVEHPYGFGDLPYAVGTERVAYAANAAAQDTYELYSRRLDGVGDALRLNTPLVPRGQIGRFAVSPDGLQVAFLASQLTAFVDDVYAGPLDGSTPTQRLNTGGEVGTFRFTPDSTQLVFVADQRTVGKDELFIRPLDGSAPATRLNDTFVPPGGDIISFRIDPTGARAFYVADQEVDNVFELYSVPLAGGGSCKLGGPFDIVDASETSYAVSPDGLSVVYRADGATPGVSELFVRAADCSGASVRLNADLVAGGEVLVFTIAPIGRRVLYVADEEVNGRNELYSCALDPGADCVKLNGPLVNGGSVLSVMIGADGQTVTYTADQDQDAVVELYTVPIDGSTPPVKISQPLVAGGNVSQPQRSPDNRRVAYLADAVTDGLIELWLRAADGSGPAASVTAAVSEPGPAPFDYFWSPTGERLFHKAVQDHPNTTELWATTFCGDAVPDPAESCDDGNRVSGDCCSSACLAEVATACDDGDPCTVGTVCDASGQCDAGTPASCDDGNLCTRDSCEAGIGCRNEAAPATGCRLAGKAKLDVSRFAIGGRVKAQWLRSSSPIADFGDPTADTDYAVCVYDAHGAVVGLQVPAAAPCASGPCWQLAGPSNAPTGVRFRDHNGDFDGLQKLDGKSSTGGKAKLKLAADGANLPPIDMSAPLDAPVTFQILTSDAGCWEAVFDANDATRNTGASYRARSR